MITGRKHVLADPPARREVREYACDKCGRPVGTDDGDGFRHELVVALDQDHCVHYLRERDYCPACLGAVWDALNELIGGDPDYTGSDREEE